MTIAIRFFAGLCLTLVGAGPVAAGERVELSTRPGVTQGVYFDSDASHPSWVLILFSGGNGNLALAPSGPRKAKGNFVIKTAPYWLKAGQAVAMFDAPSDHAAAGMGDTFRLSRQAAQDVAAAVAQARQRYPGAKIALLGTSRGTVTVGNVLKRSPALADAYVLTSPVTQAVKQPGLSGMSWPGNTARVLVVSNEHDGCFVSPFAAAKSMAAANRFDFIAASSSAAKGDQCGPQSPHGYLGIEDSVLQAIQKWLMPAS
ncbi:MAG: serine aminopeptidase domain-containing protein [Bordetella sp.]|uniref:serine aminopeptidase domain-containing protein n=1 Tax=Bordetella sp. TaxID=28081 RepID=UPI003F7B98A6